MSRLRRLKEKTRKNTIKTTMASLALILAIGSTQVIGTYALFTDNVDVSSDLSISTGDVDVKVGKGPNITDVQPGQKIEIPVTITNQGTLNQNIKLDLSISDAIKPYLTDAEYKFNKVKISKSTIEDENGIMYKEDNSLFVLTPGNSIEGTIIIDIKQMDRDTQNNLSKVKHSVDLKVKSTQISDNNKVFKNGFYDEVTQTNTITIAEKEIITIAVGEKAHYINDGGNRYTSLFIPVNVKGIDNDEINITATIKDSRASYKAEYVDKGKYKYIKITPETNKYIEFQDTLNITINIKIGETEEYSQLCWVIQSNASNSNCEESNHPKGEKNFRCQIQVVNAGHKTSNTVEEIRTAEEIKLSNEELDVPSKPETVETPKEEVGTPNESEVVESPKEEILVPSKPDIIEPLREEIEIQE